MLVGLICVLILPTNVTACLSSFKSFCLTSSRLVCGVCESQFKPYPGCSKCLSLHDSLAACAALCFSQKGGELGLSILGCELRQRLDKAASGSQPIGSLSSVLHSYGCMIGPGVAGRGMDTWQKETRTWNSENVSFHWVRERMVSYSFIPSYVKTIKWKCIAFCSLIYYFPSICYLS